LKHIASRRFVLAQVLTVLCFLCPVHPVGKKCIFGQLAQLTEGVYSLEDVHSHIPLNLNSPNLMLSSGLFTEGCLVLVEGETRDDGAFHACTLISPPAEAKSKSISVFPQLDWLESDLTHAKRSPELLMKQRLLNSSEHANDMIVMLSDVHLDKPAVLAKLATMLEGLVSSAPPAFVFHGNFTSRPFSSQPGETARLKAAFDSLADLIGKFPSLARESHFVFIPGPGDLPLSMASCLPSPSIPAAFTAKLREKLSHCTFASNPCRMSWITKEIVFFREDLLHKMRRNCIRPPSEMETTDISQHLVKTLIDQAHLSPLTMEKRPIYWNYDHALRLYPLPDVLVLADCVDQYEWPYEGVKALNPGTFAHDYSFVVYFPAQDKAEFSRC
jgi:DNA polymerase epsilon subunit 2